MEPTLSHQRAYPISVEYTLTKKQYVKLFLLSNFNWVSYVVFAFYIAFTVFVRAVDGYGCLLILAWGIFGFYVAFLLLSMLYIVFSSESRLFFVPKQYVFHEDRIEETTEISQCTITWDAVNKWKTVSDWYILSLSPVNTIGVPRSQIPDEQISAFEELLRIKVKKV